MGAGPDPYELLVAALGICSSMTLRMYADRHGWPLQQVSVTLRHERVHAEDRAGCETGHGLVDRISRAIRLEGDLSARQRGLMLQVAQERCPLHRALTTETVITTTESRVDGSGG